MTRKFHFQPSNTGDLVAVEVADNENWYFELYQNYSQVGSVVPAIVLNSNDWQEITQEPILLTEDGYELCDKDEQIWFVLFNSQDNNYEMVKASYSAMPNPDSKKAFYYYEKAEAYIESHKPRYNIKDLMFLRQEVKNAFSWYWTEQEIKDAILKTIIDLKNSKK